MSWSITAVGKPAAVKAALATQFENAKKSTASIPHECESVGLAEQMVNGQLVFLAGLNPQPAVSVEARGSAYTSGGSGDSRVELKVSPLFGFIE